MQIHDIGLLLLVSLPSWLECSSVILAAAAPDQDNILSRNTCQGWQPEFAAGTRAMEKMDKSHSIRQCSCFTTSRRLVRSYLVTFRVALTTSSRGGGHTAPSTQHLHILCKNWSIVSAYYPRSHDNASWLEDSSSSRLACMLMHPISASGNHNPLFTDSVESKLRIHSHCVVVRT